MDSSADDFSRPEAGDDASDVNCDGPGPDTGARVPPSNSPGMWLTASAWLPLKLFSSGRPAPGDAGAPAVAGFGQGGLLDQLPPGPVLATFLSEAAGGIGGTGVTPPPDDTARAGDQPSPGDAPSKLARLTDDDLTGMIRAWQKQASLAQAGQLAAVAELTRRRHAEALAAGFRDSIASEGANDEVAAALTLTGRAAELLVDEARAMQDLPRTFAALAAGRIDMRKALVLVVGLGGQDPELARAVEAEVIDRAETQTTGQLRAALTRALLAADPAAAERRRQNEEKHARIEQLPEPGGVTGTLAGRFLPVTAAVAAWNRITALARQLKTAGAPGTLDELRVHVYLSLLTGQAIAAPAPSSPAEPSCAAGPSGPADGQPGPERLGPEDPDPASERPPGRADASDSRPAGADRVRRLTDLTPVQSGGLTGTVNLTVPLTTLLGLTEGPGELGGFGPITAHTAREVAAAALDSAAVRWCVTVTGGSGEAVGHGCAHRARSARGDPAPNWSLTVKLAPLATIDCGHERESNRYRPPPSLWHLIQIRNQRCTYPGCRMPAARCDDEHTIPFDKGGRSCECNLGPVCRHHHRVKQRQGWRLEQPEPGVLVWVTPAGWKYITGPASYAA
ncbi:MAG TPA: hypothetical protein VGN41_07835 [Streptosporangiaceae bacterium]